MRNLTIFCRRFFLRTIIFATTNSEVFLVASVKKNEGSDASGNSVCQHSFISKTNFSTTKESTKKKMFAKSWRQPANICTLSSTSKVFNCDSPSENLIIIWCDTSINHDEPDDRYTINELSHVSKQVFIFMDEKRCLEYVEEIEEKNKVILIVSGLVGERFVPEIHDRVQIYWIYVFCGMRSRHQRWAQQYKKIKGVFDKIEELRQDLEQEKKNLILEQMCRTIVDLSLSIFPQFSKSQSFRNISNPKSDDDYQPKDDWRKSMIATDVSFSKAVSPVNIGELEMNNIQCSENVSPYMPYKQQMAFADTGIWPCVCTINETRDDLVTRLHSAMEQMQYFHSTENYLQHFQNHTIDPHFIILSNPPDIEHVSQLLQQRVRRLYIHCSNHRLNEYDTWAARHPKKVSVLQHFDTLTRLILWDLSACVVDIANYYGRENRKDLAETRYRYAHRLLYRIQGNLNNRLEIIEYNRSLKFDN